MFHKYILLFTDYSHMHLTYMLYISKLQHI